MWMWAVLKTLVLNLMEWVAYGVTVYSNTPTHQQERVPTESEDLERGSGSVAVAVHPGFFGPRESANQKDLPPGYPATLSKKTPALGG